MKSTFVVLLGDEEEQLSSSHTDPISISGAAPENEEINLEKVNPPCRIVEAHGDVAPTYGSPPRRTRSLPKVYGRCSFALTMFEPCSFEEANKYIEWLEAMKEELNAIERNETWETVKLPFGKKLIGLKWVFKTKFQPNGDVLKYKAHLVAKGYS